MILLPKMGSKSCIPSILLHGDFENRAQRRICYTFSGKIMHSVGFDAALICLKTAAPCIAPQLMQSLKSRSVLVYILPADMILN